MCVSLYPPRHNQCRDEQDGSSDAALSVMPEYLVSSSIVLKETDAILMISFPFESRDIYMPTPLTFTTWVAASLYPSFYSKAKLLGPFLRTT